MAEENGQEDKQYEASQRKLDKAREQGEVARAPDLNAFAVYLGLLLTTAILGPMSLQRIAEEGGAFLADADRLAAETIAGSDIVAQEMVKTIVGQSALWLGGSGLLVLATVLVTRAAVFAPTRLMPKASRVSLVQGAKNKFGTSGLFEFAKSSTKLVLYGGTLGGLLWWASDYIVASAALPVGQSAMLLGRLLLIFLALVTGIAAVIGAVDFVYQKHAHAQKNRMSRKEMTDEHKESEGDPQLKQKRRQRAQEIAQNQMLSDVPDATVVIVNPTHYAVALKWSPLDPSPPVCLAKGVDEIAVRIRELATENDIPIFSDPPTARALHATVDLGEAIPREHFRAVAAAIRFAEDLRKAAGGGA
ncbi:flagellar type III secretion system protein FlhB [Jannaschia sp. LMIT008]|uniref:EscU/YscU/HrcU family type III secretion system export apparatus switch protein n=1 Tax=Jannaschia maritima TaxID=3032585 RepID=UPI0028123858|nr:flagellar type III secretion system protein FlhB [Jannaschia sp. LMIT008]